MASRVRILKILELAENSSNSDSIPNRDKEIRDASKELHISEYQDTEKENIASNQIYNNSMTILGNENKNNNISEESISILTEELITSGQLDPRHEDEACNTFTVVYNNPTSISIDDIYLSNYSDDSMKDKDYQPDLDTEADTDTDSRSEHRVNTNVLLPAFVEGVPSTSREMPNSMGNCDIPQSHNHHPRIRKVQHKSTIKQKGKKRVRNVSEWKANARKRNYASGKTYISKRGKIVPCKVMKPACIFMHNCRMKCNVKISETKREEIFNFYWDPEKDHNVKRQFIVSCIQSKPTARQRLRSGDASKLRSNTLVYSFVVNGVTTTICKTMFLNTLSISQQVVKTALTKRQEAGIIERDKRGTHEPSNKTDPETIQSVISHISSFPKYECHYNRERSKRCYLGPDLNVERMYHLYKTYNVENNVPVSKIAKCWLYRELFNTKFNLTFKPPKVDTCDDCDMFAAKLKALEDGPDKQLVELDKQLHLIEAENRYKLKSRDMTEAKCNNKHRVLAADLQKCLPTPFLTNGVNFYKRKLWTLNYTIYDGSDSSAHCFMWDETKAQRGGNEIASSILNWATKNIPGSDIEQITIWSDNCYGQNKNICIVMCMFFLLKKFPQLINIELKYLLKGHTHMEADTVHANIERKRKKLPTLTILTPWDWQQFIRQCSNKYTVINMEVEDFKNFQDLLSTNGPLINRKISIDKQPFQISKSVNLRVTQENFGFLYYKTSFDDDNFKIVDLRRQKRKELIFPESLQRINQNLIPISVKKYKDIQDLLLYLPSYCHDFYKNLPHSSTASDFPDDDNDDAS